MKRWRVPNKGAPVVGRCVFVPLVVGGGGGEKVFTAGFLVSLV